MISVNLTVEQLESIHCALFFMAQYHDESDYMDDDDATTAKAAAEAQQIRLVIPPFLAAVRSRVG